MVEATVPVLANDKLRVEDPKLRSTALAESRPLLDGDRVKEAVEMVAVVEDMTKERLRVASTSIKTSLSGKNPWEK